MTIAALNNMRKRAAGQCVTANLPRPGAIHSSLLPQAPYAKTPGTLATTVSADVSGTAAQVHAGPVGILIGDVDGSFAGAPGSQDLDLLRPSCFVDLTHDHGLQLAQFGVYA